MTDAQVEVAACTAYRKTCGHVNVLAMRAALAAAQVGALSQEDVARFAEITPQDREYATDLIDDIEEDINDRAAQEETAARWFRKVRHEALLALRPPAAPAERTPFDPQMEPEENWAGIKRGTAASYGPPLSASEPARAPSALVAAGEVIDAARAMPRTTLSCGSAGTKNIYEIEAGAVWALDRALRKYDAAQLALLRQGDKK